jgi:HEPN domain-containing protein
MGLDPVLAENTRAWLEKSRADLRRVELLLSAEDPDVEDALFHCQQAAEKALKAFLTWHDQPFRKTHDLEALGRQCRAIDPTLGALLANADMLTEYAWAFRYPDSPPEPSEAEVEQARRLANDIAAAILQRLPPEVRPD